MLTAVFCGGKPVASSATMPPVIPQVLSEAQRRETKKGKMNLFSCVLTKTAFGAEIHGG
jgi:hypothetical protein